MPSAFTLTLDTHAPALWLGQPVLLGGMLRIPYAVDEPSITEVFANASGSGDPIEGTVNAEFLLFDLGGGEFPAGTVHVSVRDEVGNELDYSRPVSFSTVVFHDVTTKIVDPPSGAIRPRYYTGAVEHNDPVPSDEKWGAPPNRRGFR
jgi:hypothetical protein